MEENKEMEMDNLQEEQLEEAVEATEESTQEANEEVELSEEEKLKAELEKAENSVKELNDRLLRNMAEFDNFRKRTISEKAMMYDNGVKDAVEKLLPVVDNFERAVVTVSEEDKASNVYKGVEMILKQFLEILDNLGVKEIPAEGEEFDPNVHNAVMTDSDENVEDNHITVVLQKGYKYNDRVIRPSMVKVNNIK